MKTALFENIDSKSLYKDYEYWVNAMNNLSIKFKIISTSLTCNPELGSNGWYTFIVTYALS